MNRETAFLFILLLAKVSFLNAEKLLQELPASVKQRTYLARFVCIELFKEDPDTAEEMDTLRRDRAVCEKNFLGPNHIPGNPPNVTIKKRTKDNVTVRATPSEHIQIVALLNEQKRYELIHYTLIKDNEEPDALFPHIAEKYTFWTAVLSSNGTSSLWKRGPVLQPWQNREESLQNGEENNSKQYDIKLNFLMESFKNDVYAIDGQFRWNSRDPTDLYFDVINNCAKNIQGNLYDKQIGPVLNPAVVIPRLPLNDTCTIRVRGKYPMTNFTYRTPTCETVPHCEPAPEIPLNVTMEVSEEVNSNLWSVRVRWAQQRYAPIDYNVTLRAHTVHSRTVPGNETEVQFKNVKGKGLFNVSVVAEIPGKEPAVAIQRDIFPVRETGSSGVMTGVYCAAALFTVIMLLMAIHYVRRSLVSKYSTKMYYPGTLESTGEDFDKDSGSLASSVEDHWEVRPERLMLHEVLGEGAFGVVRRGTLAPANKNVAVKMLKDFPSLEEIRSFRAEMELMKSVGAHPHVVSLVGCCSGRRPLIVAEYCSRGDLLTYLRCSWDLMVSRRNAKYFNNNKECINYRYDQLKNKPDSQSMANRLYDLEGVCDTELTLLELLSFCRQIAMGMEFLASNRVVHRDLAARNILVTADRTLKIADFGLSRDVYQENQYKQKSNGKIPVKWMALESLTHRIYTTQTDVWSFGVVMWEVVTVGGAPYAGVSVTRLPRLLAAGYRMPRPHNCSVPLYQLMLSCWNDRPRSRPTFSELHAALDELLSASADHYLSLSLPVLVPDDVTSNTSLTQYVRNFLRGNKRNTKMYARTHNAPTNHYSTQPAALALT